MLPKSRNWLDLRAPERKTSLIGLLNLAFYTYVMKKKPTAGLTSTKNTWIFLPRKNSESNDHKHSTIKRGIQKQAFTLEWLSLDCRASWSDDENSANQLFLFSKNVKITISNPGPVAVYDLIPQIIFDDKVVSSNYIPQLPPFANFETSFKIPYGLLAKKAPTLVSINAYRSEIFIPTNKNQSIISQILTLAFLLIIIIIFTYIRLTHIRIFEILLKQKFKLSNVRFLKKNKG